MFKFLKYSALALALAFGSSTFAHAEAFTAIGPNGGWWSWFFPPPQPPPSKCPDKSYHVAPEVDPGLALSGLALLGGSLTVMRARRRNR